MRTKRDPKPFTVGYKWPGQTEEFAAFDYEQDAIRFAEMLVKMRNDDTAFEVYVKRSGKEIYCQ